MSMPKWIERTLEQEHVRFHSRHHRPRFTSQEVAAEEHVSGHRLAKVVVVKADDGMVEVVVPASQRINMEAVRRELGCQNCRLASEPEIAERFDDCEVGAIPPLRHWPDVQILMDRHLFQLRGPLLFQAGTHEDAIEMEFADWYRITQPRDGDFTGTIN
jgi:Ala-tRNA(Pro) deacylase